MKTLALKMQLVAPFLWVAVVYLFLTTSCNRGDTFSRSGQGPSIAPNQGQAEFKLSEKQVIYRKNNLETLSIGRNRIEIEEMMGPPEGRSLDGGNGYLWDYRRAVYDEVSDTTYRWSLVSFKFLKGLCAYVTIRLEHPPVQLVQEPGSPSESSFDK